MQVPSLVLMAFASHCCHQIPNECALSMKAIQSQTFIVVPTTVLRNTCVDRGASCKPSSSICSSVLPRSHSNGALMLLRCPDQSRIAHSRCLCIAEGHRFLAWSCASGTVALPYLQHMPVEFEGDTGEASTNTCSRFLCLVVTEGIHLDLQQFCLSICFHHAQLNIRQCIAFCRHHHTLAFLQQQ